MKDLSLHILDICQNSIRAKATNIKIEIIESKSDDLLSISIVDDGKGMDEDELKKAIDPFYTSRTTRKVGLGLSLLKQNVENTNGKFELNSEKGKGTKLVALFEFSHLDRPILGDITGILLILFADTNNINIEYVHQTIKGEFKVCSYEIKEILDGVQIDNPDIRKSLTDYISNNLKQIQISE